MDYLAKFNRKAYQTQLFINNEFVDSDAGETFPTINPTNEEVICHVQRATAADVDKAVAAARKAFESKAWRGLEPSTRARLLFRLADLLEANKEEFAHLEAVDNGKPYMFALYADIPSAASTFRYYAGCVDKIQGRQWDHGFNGKEYLSYIRKEPIGVCGLIVPWNFPLWMLSTKIAPALCTANTVVLKAAEQTPLTSLHFGRLVVEAGFPPGVVNILAGFGPDCGAAICRHPDVNKISFTGSVETGMLVHRMCSEVNLKRCTLELGGKSPLIVFGDADLAAACEAAHSGCFFNSGQVCVASSRLFVQDNIYDKFIDMCVERATKAVLGDPFHPKTTMGSLVDKEQFDKVMALIDSGVQQGARLVTGGKSLRADGKKGFYVVPTIFADVQDHMTIAQVEIFGPVMSILRFSTAEEAVRRANTCNYDLCAGVFTANMSNAIAVSNALKSGVVFVNTYMVMGPAVSFGGYSKSGIGREGGLEVLDEYTVSKSVLCAFDQLKLHD